MVKIVNSDIDKQTCDYLLTTGEMIAVYKFIRGEPMNEHLEVILDEIRNMPRGMFQWC